MNYIKSLTSIRGYCALLIVFTHYHFFLQQIDITYIQKTLRYGTIGVDIFFILSGFFLTYIYRNKLRESKNIKNELYRFFIYRIARIYPLYLITLILSTILIYVGWTENKLLISDATNLTSSFLYNLFMINGLGIYSENKDIFSINSPSWSLSIEMFIYVLFPIIIIIAYRIKSVSLNIVIIATIYYHLFMITKDHGVISSGDEILYTLAFWKNDFLHGLELFIIGVSTSNIYERNFLRKLPWDIINILIIFVISLLIYLAIDMNYFIFVSPFLIYSLANISPKTDKYFSNKFSFYIGEISYSIYMWHIPYAVIVNHFFPLSTADLWEWKWIPLITGLLVISSISYHFIESPPRSWIKNKLSTKTN